ncbi:hypothetical protein CEXT_546941 [Caerostris extrusa]|uniref:Uncharacterized protein n=1 Tax=Caerostris extrusa TaxID=172846 RepID=A0AAV4VGT8_CAEEX|nr:hypothetical protein CEXT_546941 [Caerostris extrusa]
MVKPSQSAKTGTSMQRMWSLYVKLETSAILWASSGRVDLVCGTKTGTSIFNSGVGRGPRVWSLYVTTRNGETSAIKNWNLDI